MQLDQEAHGSPPGRFESAVTAIAGALDQLPAAAWATDRQLRIRFCLGRALERVGVRSSDLLGRTVDELVQDQGHASELLEAHRRALEGELRRCECSFRGRVFEVQVGPFRDEAGELAGCLAALLDVTERKAAEEASRTAARRMAEAERVAGVGSWEWDPHANRVVWTEELHRLHGLRPGEFAGTYEAFLERVHPDDRESVGRGVAQALERPGPFSFEHRTAWPDGTVRILSVRGDVLCDSEGRPVRMIGACHDITDRRKAEQARERALSLLQATLESTADGILVVDRQGKFASYNEQFATMWRIPREILLAGDDARALDYVLSQLVDPQGFLRKVQQLYGEPEAESFDVLRFGDGRVFERLSKPQRTGREIAGRVWSFRDVTERRRVEAERDRLLIAERESRLATEQAADRSTLLADASRLLASLDLEGALSGAACLLVPRFADWCVVDIAEVDGGSRRLTVGVEPGKKDLAQQLEQRPEEPIGPRSELVREIGHRSSRAVPLAVGGRKVGTLTLVLAGEERALGPEDLAMLQDLAGRTALAAENARLYRRLQEALRARDEFLSIASHELRTPLSSLYLAVQALARSEAEPRTSAGGALSSRRLLATVQRQARRLEKLIDEMLDVTRLQAGRVDLESEELDLVELAREVVARFEPEAEAAHTEVRILAREAVVGQWDRSRLDQVISNLLSNAIRYGEKKPVDVSVERWGDRAVLQVVDRGIGISPERLPYIFDRFERAVSPRHYGGLGLGLYIASRLASRMGGSLAARSELGKGSTFTVELPIARAQ
ncbi:MAG: PAS domain-containing protein [Myxococcales bacterium]|nr:PAS domain-containing protein [Myxococcales bacterium]